MLKISCDYLLKDDKSIITEVPMQRANSYVDEWTKLYPILGEYQITVDRNKYHRIFTAMIKEMMTTYNYSSEDAVLVLKDLMYKTYLEIQKQERQKI
ncbi:MAG TPA: hypothetical protein VIM70_20880 [Clostridium sp.]|uniref:hypothetical protein n=1 Tax=Clostridium sp. TaxID=1506 RepID=UPI002F93EE06